MIVKCVLNSTNKLLQQNAFSFVQQKVRSSNVTNNTGTRPPSVLLIGIDTLSRINFRRTMPKTAKYLEDNNWFELQGYNKMGDNTFPNLMAVLTGYNNTESYSKCQPKSVGGLDKCSIIWKSFKKSGYWTAYAEDLYRFSTFNYLKKGFENPPTDYYLRPMTIALESTLPIKKVHSQPFCVGRKQYGEYIYDYALQFANRYLNESIFGLFWTNSFSHNSFDTPSTMDTRMCAYFKEMEMYGILESSIVMFFSDHGCRWGPLLNLPEGFNEERLPMFFISLPSWFKNQYPSFVDALHVNKHRLTSPYDIHMTLKHLLKLSQPNIVLPPTDGCKQCQSIFYEVPGNRTCLEAGIIEHWCTCIPYHTKSTSDQNVKKFISLVIDRMNDYIKSRNFSSLCSPLHLKTIKEAQLKIEEESSFQKDQSLTYRVKFIVKEGEASFQTTALFYPKSVTVDVNVEEISRLNSYEKYSGCLDDKQGKKYCICKK